MMQGKPRTRDLLARLPLFSALPPDEIEVLAGGASEVMVRRGEILFRRDEPCLGFHAVVYGQIRLFLGSPAGGEKVVRLIGPGDSFGEALMFLNRPYVVSAQALADTLLLHVDRATIMARIQGRPDFACRMLASLSQRLHALMSDVEAYSLRSGMQRVAAYVLRESEGADAFRLETGKAIIASRLNLTPEHFSRILRDLEDRGLIRVDGRDIAIPDRPALQRHHG